jgi:MFS family permease
VTNQVDKKTETSNIKQLTSVLRSETPGGNRNLILYLASVLFITLSLGGSANFMTSWVVHVIGVNEADAASLLSITTFASTLAVLPAGYLAAGKFGRRNIYLVGILIMAAGAILMIIAPAMYILSFILLGAGTGTVLSSMLALLFDVSPQKEVSGALVGIYNVAYMIGFIFGSMIVGWIIEMTSYNTFFPALLVLGISSALCASLINIKQQPQVSKAWA